MGGLNVGSKTVLPLRNPAARHSRADVKPYHERGIGYFPAIFDVDMPKSLAVLNDRNQAAVSDFAAVL